MKGYSDNPPHVGRKLPRLNGIFVAFLLLTATSAFSQTMTTGDVVGTVTDTTGAVVPKATVTIKLPDTNETRTAVTSETGHYRFSLLKPGDYTIEAETTGLKSKLDKFTLLVGQEAAINLTLAVTGTQEIVEVQGEAAVLQTENANLTSGFNTAQVANLPMNGGDITTIAFTVPGVLVLPGGGAAGNFNVNGIPGASTLFTLNGADDMDPYLNINNSGASNNTLGGNEVAEAAVVLNAFSADYGRMAGAQVNYISKSGSNSMHGNLYYNYNDAIFNANDFFNNASGTPRGRADANQFVGSVSGPIRKNKLFYFFNYESLRYVLPSAGVVAVPSPQLEQYALAHVSRLPRYRCTRTPSTCGTMRPVSIARSRCPPALARSRTARGIWAAETFRFRAPRLREAEFSGRTFPARWPSEPMSASSMKSR